MANVWTDVQEGDLATPASINDRLNALRKGDVFNAKAYGAVGNGSTSDKAAIEAAAAAALAAYVDSDGRKWGTLLLPASQGYATSASITIPAQVNVIQEAPIFYTGSSNEPALIIGDSANLNPAHLWGLNVKRQTQSTWTGESVLSEANIGILLHNPYASEIYVRYVQGFTIGVQVLANTNKQTSFNNFRIGRLVDNKYALDIMSVDLSGAPNENNFIGGYYTCNSGVNNGKSRYGVRIATRTGSYYANNNVFIKPCFEIDASSQATPGEAVPILIETGTANHFYDIRDEGNGSVLMRCANDSTGNTVVSGYDEGNAVEQTGTLGDNMVIYSTRRPFAQCSQTVAVFDNMRDRVNRTDNNAQIIGMSTASSGDAVIRQRLDGIRLVGDAVEIASTSGIGIKIDTSRAKNFVLHRGVASSSNGGRVIVRAYDSNGAVLTSGGASHPYVRGASGLSFSYSADFGGAYQTGSDSSQSIYFNVKDDVKSVWVGVIGGTAVALIKSIVIACDANIVNAPATTTGLTIRNDIRMALVSPTKGPGDDSSWPAGTVQWDIIPASGSPPGWVCVSQVDTTVRVAHAGGAGNLEVVTTTGMANNDIIGVVLDNGNTHWTAITSVVDGDTLTLTANMPSAAAVGKAVLTFRYAAMANLA